MWPLRSFCNLTFNCYDLPKLSYDFVKFAYIGAMGAWTEMAIKSYAKHFETSNGYWVVLVVRPGFELGTSCTKGSECTTTDYTTEPTVFGFS